VIAAIAPAVVFIMVVILGVVYDIDCSREGRPWW
jgi:hypothetical protein